MFFEVSTQLDASGRDDALFKSLLIYDDNVRGSVVKCLLKVPLEQFEDEEVGKIMELLQSCNNVSAGKIEIVLSGIYWIFYRMMHNSRQPEELQHQAAKTLVMKYGELLVNNAMDVLTKNL